MESAENRLDLSTSVDFPLRLAVVMDSAEDCVSQYVDDWLELPASLELLEAEKRPKGSGESGINGPSSFDLRLEDAICVGLEGCCCIFGLFGGGVGPGEEDPFSVS